MAAATAGSDLSPMRWLVQQMDRVKRHCPNLLNLFTVNSANPRCLSCDSTLMGGYGFCSASCYWENLRRFRDQYSKENGGTSICALESCNKPCHKERGRVHDYCCRGHANEHKQRINSVWPVTSWGHGHFPVYQQETQRRHGYNLRSHPALGHSNSGHGPIFFYDRNDPYYEFTNFAYYPIVINGIRFPTSEHYFQSQKLIGTPFLHKVCELPRPRQAFEYPRQPHVSVWVRQDWQSIKDDVMYRALIAKFTQHPYLKNKLLETGDRMLVEHSPYDSYWGDGGDGKGLNRLGELLMKLRAAFRREGKKLGWREEQDKHKVAAQFSPNQPTSGDQYTNPTSGDRYSNPTSGDQYTNPTSGDQYTNPTSGDRYSSPTSGDRYMDPASGNPSVLKASDIPPPNLDLSAEAAKPYNEKAPNSEQIPNSEQMPELPSVYYLSGANTDPQQCLEPVLTSTCQDTTASLNQPSTPHTTSENDEEPMDTRN